METENGLDVAQVYLVYAALIGDAEKTAIALDLELAVVTRLAEKYHWAEKIRRISVMSKSGVPGDWERAQNRALNFVQAHQLRRSIDRAVLFLSSQSAEQLLTKTDKEGNTSFSARIFGDIGAAMQKVHDLTYAALGDTPKERTERTGDEDHAPGAQALHTTLISTLNAAQLTQSTAESLVAEAVQTVESLKSAKPSQ